jgi:hypothetical protein
MSIKGGTMSDNTTTKPIFKLRYGNVSAAVWLRNTASAGYFYDTTFTRGFLRGDSTWGDSTSFEDRDLPNLAKAAADVHTWIYQQKASAVTVSGSESA